MPEFGSRLASDLTKADIVRAVDRIADRGAGIAANRTLALLRKLYNWAMAEGLVEANPAAGIPMRAKEQSRERVLDDGEIASFWSALGVSGFDAATADVLRLQLLLGARIREVTDLHVSELDFAGAEAVWRLPRERAKAGRAIVRPLPPLAVAIIKRRLHDDAFVFASRTNPGRPMTPRAPARAVRRAAQKGLLPFGFTPHDLRRTAATKLAALGVEEAVASAFWVTRRSGPTCLQVCTTVTPIYPRCGARWKNSNSMCWRLSIARRLRKLCVFVEQMVRVMKSIADLPDDFACASLTELLQIQPPRRHSELPYYVRMRRHELSDAERRLAEDWCVAQKIEYERVAPYLRQIAELECTVGQLRCMSDDEIIATLGVKPWAVARVRVGIGPPRPGSQSASVDVKVLTRLERDLRKAQGADRLESVNFAEFERAFFKSANPADRQRLIYSWLLYVRNY